SPKGSDSPQLTVISFQYMAMTPSSAGILPWSGRRPSSGRPRRQGPLPPEQGVREGKRGHDETGREGDEATRKPGDSPYVDVVVHGPQALAGVLVAIPIGADPPRRVAVEPQALGPIGRAPQGRPAHHQRVGGAVRQGDVEARDAGKRAG